MRRPPAAAKRFESREMFRCGITLSCADSFELFGRDVDVKAPARHVMAVSRQGGIERKIGWSERLAQSGQVLFRSNPIQFEQVAEAARDCSDAQAQGVIHKLRRLHVQVSHPQTFAYLRHSSAILRLPKSVNNGALQVADIYRLLFGDPMFSQTKKILLLDQNESKLSAVQSAVWDTSGARSKNDELRLSDHAMNFHGRSVGDKAGSVAC